MFELIYFILGIYAIKVILAVFKRSYINRKNAIDLNKVPLRIIIFSKFKKLLKDRNNIFIFKNNKIEEEELKVLNEEEDWREKRHMALEKSKYKCEECGNITNLDVYHKEDNSLNSKDDSNLVVLCKKCHEGYGREIIPHYQGR